MLFKFVFISIAFIDLWNFIKFHGIELLIVTNIVKF